MPRIMVLLLLSTMYLSCAMHEKPKTEWPSVPTGCEWRQINPDDITVIYLLQRESVDGVDQWLKSGACESGKKEFAIILAKYTPQAEIWWYLEESPMGVFTGYLLLENCKVIAKAPCNRMIPLDQGNATN